MTSPAPSSPDTGHDPLSWVRAGMQWVKDRYGSTKGEPMPDRFYPLATYNGECARGLVHTPEYQERMAELQADFDEWRRRDRLS